MISLTVYTKMSGPQPQLSKGPWVYDDIYELEYSVHSQLQSSLTLSMYFLNQLHYSSVQMAIEGILRKEAEL